MGTYWWKSKIKVFLFLQNLFLKISLVTLFRTLRQRFQSAECIQEAACGSENCSLSRLFYVTGELTNSRSKDRKYHWKRRKAGTRSLMRPLKQHLGITKCFQRRKQKLYNSIALWKASCKFRYNFRMYIKYWFDFRSLPKISIWWPSNKRHMSQDFFMKQLGWRMEDNSRDGPRIFLVKYPSFMHLTFS